ncbi:hypothetical protein LQZ19_11460 [Treponema primitia]|uniref:hypothetical protein n=1 Tax=Treponema primitia TaxID=88058 RepID=UPI0039805FB9
MKKLGCGILVIFLSIGSVFGQEGISGTSPITSVLPFLAIVIIIVGVIIAKKQEKEDESDFNNNIIVDDGFKRKKINKIVRVSLSGGLIGAVATNPRKALEKVIQKYNSAGWNCHQILDHATRNIFISIIQIVILIVTLGLWTFGAGYLVLFEKDNTDYSQR